MKKLIVKVLSNFQSANLASESAKETIADAILDEVRKPNQGWYLDLGKGVNEYKSEMRAKLGGDYTTKKGN